MWTLGIAIAAIGAVIALLLILYLRLSAREDAPAAAAPAPLKRLPPVRPLQEANERLPDRRAYPVRVVPEGERAVMLLFPDVPEAVVVGTSEDDAFDKAVPVLEAILTGYVDEGRPLPAASSIGGARTVRSARFG